MKVTLNTILEECGLSLEIFVEFDTKDNVVDDILSIYIHSPVGLIPVGDLFVNIPELEVAINKIIDRTNWREVYRDKEAELWAA